jgi:uncharacterized protein with HEPN domain
MRHELTHEYFSANWSSMWSTATTDLPNLKAQFQRILAELE